MGGVLVSSWKKSRGRNERIIVRERRAVGRGVVGGMMVGGDGAVFLWGAMMLLPVLSCAGCGMCCYIQRVPPYMETELDALPAELLKEWMKVSEGVAEGTEGPCVWLNGEKKCSHYEERPEVCRQFEMGGEDCREVRERWGIG
jgi:uncharacterized protein